MRLVCAHVYVRVCVSMCVYVCTCVHVCVCICEYACVFGCMGVRTYVCRVDQNYIYMLYKDVRVKKLLPMIPYVVSAIPRPAPFLSVCSLPRYR